MKDKENALTKDQLLSVIEIIENAEHLPVSAGVSEIIVAFEPNIKAGKVIRTTDGSWVFKPTERTPYGTSYLDR